MNWAVYTRDTPRYHYALEYPDGWSVEERGDITSFIPPGSPGAQKSVSVIVINYAETPPLPVDYTYTTIRKVSVGEDTVLVQQREPSSITERYIAELQREPYTIEFRYLLDPGHDDIFDHLLISFSFNNKP